MVRWSWLVIVAVVLLFVHSSLFVHNPNGCLNTYQKEHLQKEFQRLDVASCITRILVIAVAVAAAVNTVAVILVVSIVAVAINMIDVALAVPLAVAVAVNTVAAALALAIDVSAWLNCNC